MKDDLAKKLGCGRYDAGITLQDEKKIAELFGITLMELEDTALTMGIIPVRYSRNKGVLDTNEQLRLLGSRVSVIGCGGLGGYIIEELARAGVGTIQVWDYDCFQESNLNRQIMCDVEQINHYKVEAVRDRIAKVNPAVNLEFMCTEFNNQRGISELNGYHLVVDALDNISNRLELSQVCRELEIPFVHGAVEGWYGQVCTQFPGDDTIEQIYVGNGENIRVNASPSVLSCSVAAVASLQAAEALKVLLEKESLLRNRLMIIDLLDMDIEVINITPGCEK